MLLQGKSSVISEMERSIGELSTDEWVLVTVRSELCIGHPVLLLFPRDRILTTTSHKDHISRGFAVGIQGKGELVRVALP